MPVPSGYNWECLEQRFQEATQLRDSGTEATDWWTQWHRYIACRSHPGWFYTQATAREWASREWPGLAKKWVEGAESLLEDLVHAGDYRPSRLPNGDIDWGANPTKSMSWAGFHYWQWANPLIRAYALTGDERFPAEMAKHLRSYFEQFDSFVPQLWEGADPSDRDWRDFITFNDLSAGAKMATFAEEVMVFRRSPSWSACDLRRATLLLVRLACRLFEKYEGVTDNADFLRSRNFLTSGAAGLGCVAAIFPECAWASSWRGLAIRILEVHLMELYYADGGHKELCTQYHKTGIRDILFLEQVLAAQGQGYFLVREPYRSRIKRILLWLAAILMPDGTTSVLNSAAASDDWLVHFVVANRVLRDPELAWHIRRSFRPDYVPRQKSIPALCSRILGSKDAPDPACSVRKPRTLCVLLPDTGVAVLRDGWDRWANTMVLDFGRPVGGHAYPARGSFSLYLRGRPAALSPGSPHAYTDPAYRSWMHTTASQNTVMIDDLNQVEWEAKGQRRIHGEVLNWHVDADSALVQGRHTGYLANAGVVHIRSVMLLYGRFFLVHDVLDATASTASHVARWSIHCPGSPTEADARTVVVQGLMRVVPAWPERIRGIEIGACGKAVWPAAAEDGKVDTHRRLSHARWVVPLKAGEIQHFLAVVQSDGVPTRVEDARLSGSALNVRISSQGISDTVSIPMPG